MRVIFLNRYFYPDHSATSQMLSDLAFFWTMPAMKCVWSRAASATTMRARAPHGVSSGAALV